jgi:hypothetical protein
MAGDLKPGVTNSQECKTPGVHVAHPAFRQVDQRLLY